VGSEPYLYCNPRQIVAPNTQLLNKQKEEVVMNRQQRAHAFFEKEIQKILKTLLLTEYTITLKYKKKTQSLMEIFVEPAYIEGVIHYGDKAVNLFFDSPEKVFDALVHECCHILTIRLTDGRKGLSKKRYLEVEEATTEHIAKVFSQLMRKVK
jgi:hypothetical protein